MFRIILFVALLVLTISMVLFLIRIIIGPSLNDRILGLDSFGMMLVGIIAIVMILQDTIAYSDVVLVVSIIGFVGTVSLSKFLERGAVFDRD